MEKYNTVNLEIFGKYRHPPIKGEYYYPKIFRSYKGSKKQETSYYTSSFVNQAIVIILDSPQNPEFKINFSSGPKKEQFEALLKKFDREKDEYFMYYGELEPQLQDWLRKCLTDRNLINQIKKYQRQADKIKKKLKRAKNILNKLEKEEEAIWDKIYIPKKKAQKLEACLFSLSQ